LSQAGEVGRKMESKRREEKEEVKKERKEKVSPFEKGRCKRDFNFSLS